MFSRKTSGVYRILCTITGKEYVGSSESVGRRWSQHRTDLRGGYHANPHLQRAWDKYGERGFRLEVLEKCAPADLQNREQAWIDERSPELNISPNAGPPLRGRKMSKAQREKLRPYWDSQKGKPVNPPGEPLSPQHRASISESMKGNTYRRGKESSAEAKVKLSASLKKHNQEVPRSEEWRGRLSRSLNGHIVSEETKRKLSLTQKAHQAKHGNPMEGKARPDLAERNRQRVWDKEAREAARRRTAARERIDGRLA